jgi:hypothetical protein|tara:strand:- start:944 stop:2107 length:1164 start_codon:yes stop_codon:yes gene_type:complete
MEIKVRDLGELESKSTQEIEKELLEKHEAQQEAVDNPEPKDEVERVNLQEAPAEEEKVVEEKIVEEPVVETPEATTPEMSENDVLSYIEKKYGEEVSSLDDFIDKRNTADELPEDVKAYFEYKKETGRSINDFAKLQQDYDSMNPDSLIASYYSATEEGLDSEDIQYLMDDKFGFDEDLDDEKEKKKKQLAKKRELSKAKKYFKEQKEKYKLPLESREAVSESDKKEIEAYRKYIEDNAAYEKDAAIKLQWFKKETNKVFNKDFKGFEFVINDKKISYLPGSVEDVKLSQASIDNFIQRYVDDKGMAKNIPQYHRALSMAMNPDKYAKFFYEQGKADAVENISKKTKNINMDVRSTPQVTTKSGFKVRSLNQDSGRGLKIRSIKKSN